jgi:hypothetical protein
MLAGSSMFKPANRAAAHAHEQIILEEVKNRHVQVVQTIKLP